MTMKPKIMLNTAMLLLVAQIQSSQGFAPFTSRPNLPSPTMFFSVPEPAISAETISATEEQDDSDNSTMAVRAPLKFAGPYPCLGLTFPDLATPSQRERNISGISLDFVLDTAANTNTINAQVAQELGLSIVGEAPAGVGAGGAMRGGSTFLLGNCELEGLPKDEQFTFMEDLTASALPVASPASAGLLSLPFFHCFEGGVEFQWQGQTSIDEDNQQQQLPPSVTFYGAGESDAILESMTKVEVTEMPVTRLPVVQLHINGVKIPALLDTGSPITVINAQAAAAAGIETVEDVSSSKPKEGGNNPFTKFANRFQEAQEAAKAAARGDMITIAGSTGEPVRLYKSKAPASIHLPSAKEEEAVEFGSGNLYVGNLPGLAALDGLGDDSPPAAVLGMDVLRLRPKMVFVARNQEVYF